MTSTPTPRPPAAQYSQYTPEPPVHPATRPSWARIVAAVALVSAQTVASIALFLVGLAIGMDESQYRADTNQRVAALMIGGLVVFLGTSVTGGLVVRRWWGWLAPVWVVLSAFALGTVSQALGSI